jgi:pentatricopeptide repeat protein
VSSIGCCQGGLASRSGRWGCVHRQRQPQPLLAARLGPSQGGSGGPGRRLRRRRVPTGGHGSTASDSYTAALRTARGGKEAERILADMGREGKQASGAHFWEALLACARAPRSEDTAAALRLLDAMHKEGISPNINAYTVVIDILGKRGDFDRAMALFDGLNSVGLKPTLVTYRVAVRTCAKKGDIALAVGLIELMKESGVGKPDVYMYTSIIESCARRGDVENAIGTLALMKEAGVPPNIFSYMHAIRACGLSGAHDWALVLLGDAKDELEPDVQLYNAVLAACARASDGSGLERAMELLETMEEEGIMPDAVSFSSAINACATHGAQWQDALKLLDRMQERDLPPHIPAWNAMLKVLARNRQWSPALDLLERMKCRGEVGGDPPSAAIPLPNIITYSQVMEACTEGGQPRLALRLLDEAASLEGGLDRICFGVACKAAAVLQEQDGSGAAEALRLLDDMKRRGLRPNAIIYSSVIRAVGDDATMARTLLGRMYEDGLLPSGPCYTNTISSCSRAGEWQGALSLLDDAVGAGVKLNVITWTSVVDCCSQAGQWQAALDVLSRMQEAGIHPNQLSLSAAMRGCNKGGMWSKALELFDARSMPADEVMMSAALDACARGRQWRRALTFLEDLRTSDTMQLQVQHYSCTIAACAWAGETRVALDMLRQMQQDGLAPDSLCWSLAIRVCVVSGKRAEADALIHEMERAGVQLDRKRLLRDDNAR